MQTETTELDLHKSNFNMHCGTKVRVQLPGVHTKLHSFLRSNHT